MLGCLPSRYFFYLFNLLYVFRFFFLQDLWQDVQQTDAAFAKTNPAGGALGRAPKQHPFFPASFLREERSRPAELPPAVVGFFIQRLLCTSTSRRWENVHMGAKHDLAAALTLVTAVVNTLISYARKHAEH